MKPRAPSGPGANEIRLRGEVDRLQRELTRFKRAQQAPNSAASACAPASPAMSPTAPALESATRSAPASGPLEQRFAELAAEHERVKALYLEEVDQNRQRAAKLHRILENICEINSDLDLDHVLQRLAETISSTLGFRIVLIRIREPGTGRLRACAFFGIEDDARSALQAQDLSRDEFLSWLRDEFKIGQSYFISHTHDFSRRLPAGYTRDLGPRAEDEWHEDDVLLVPLFNRTRELVAYFSVDDPVDRRPPSPETIELLEIFGHHAAVAIENARLYRELESHSREIEEAGRRMLEIQTLRNHFVSTISHELRTPLTAMRAYVETLLGAREGQIDHEQLQRFLGVVNEESQRLGGLIESVLDLNRFDTGQARLTRQSVDIYQLLEEGERLLQPVAQTGQIALKLERGSADTRVDADRDQLRQLLLHLGSNAIKFTPSGGTVTFRLGGCDREVTLQVEDTGIGIPEHALDQIFERFYQVDSSLTRRFGGTGLGLAICKSIAEWHGGRVFAESVSGQGSRFTVVLPRRTEKRVAARPVSRSRVAAEDVMKLSVEIVAEIMESGVVSLMSKESDGSLTILAAVGLDDSIVRETRVPSGTGVAGWVSEHRRPVLVSPRAGRSPVRPSGRAGYRSGTFLSVPIEGEDGLLGVLNVTDPAAERSFEPDDCALLLQLSRRIAGAWQQANRVERAQSGLEGTTQALRLMLRHLERARRAAPERVRLARALARTMRLGETEVGLIGFAASLHDLGMNQLGESVTEGGGGLSDSDRDLLARHPSIGAETLDALLPATAIDDLIRCHHERWDGSGYPRGLSGHQIPIGARILAVVDAWESMTIGRAHKPARSRDDARLEILRQRERQFDPEVVDAFDDALATVERQNAAAASGSDPLGSWTRETAIHNAGR
ncbi:MAG: GAF domain-containing protein [Candidatus Eisenbacteria bacterium]|nr:GAF domain-containing protein [Candidatus Eisenbacteria bacterium]